MVGVKCFNVHSTGCVMEKTQMKEHQKGSAREQMVTGERGTREGCELLPSEHHNICSILKMRTKLFLHFSATVVS